MSRISTYTGGEGTACCIHLLTLGSRNAARPEEALRIDRAQHRKQQPFPSSVQLTWEGANETQDRRKDGFWAACCVGSEQTSPSPYLPSMHSRTSCNSSPSKTPYQLLPFFPPSAQWHTSAGNRKSFLSPLPPSQRPPFVALTLARRGLLRTVRKRSGAPFSYFWSFATSPPGVVRSYASL